MLHQTTSDPSSSSSLPVPPQSQYNNNNNSSNNTNTNGGGGGGGGFRARSSSGRQEQQQHQQQQRSTSSSNSRSYQPYHNNNHNLLQPSSSYHSHQSHGSAGSGGSGGSGLGAGSGLGLGITTTLQKGLARWTRRMSGTIASCGGIAQLPSEDLSESGMTTVQPSSSNLHQHNNNSHHHNSNSLSTVGSSCVRLTNEVIGTVRSEESQQTTHSSLSSRSNASSSLDHHHHQQQHTSFQPLNPQHQTHPRKHRRNNHKNNGNSNGNSAPGVDGSSSNNYVSQQRRSNSSSRQQQQQQREPPISSTTTTTTTPSTTPQQQYPMQPERPPRKHQQSTSTSSSNNPSSNKKSGGPASHRSYKSHSGNSGDHEGGGVLYDHDHHTLSTATTAAETISYSTDQGDASIASEVGMEVVMAVRSSEDPPSHSHGHHADDAPILPTEPSLPDENQNPADHLHHHAMMTASGGHHYHTSHPHHHGIHGMMGQATGKQVATYQSHSFPAGKHVFTVDRRYSMLRVIGSGAYGVVISATDSKAPPAEGGGPTNVAIKMVPKAFSDEIDAKRILREIKLLKHFRHDNIVRLIDMMPPNVQYLEDFHDVYMVTDLMETDLHRIIYSKQKLSSDHVQYFIYQVLRGLKYIHSCKVLHRDLKPSNLLVNSNCDLKICDFGLARGVGSSSSSSMAGNDDDHHHHHQKRDTLLLTEYVVTRWYRAPEIMLACHEYSYPIDVWSVGCIFAELMLRKPMFPGEDYIDQLTIISEKLGKLSEPDLDFVTSEKAKRFMRKLPNKAPPHFSMVFPNTPPEALDALRRMLEIHPQKRMGVNEALQHPFFSPLHAPADEPVSSRVFDFSFEKGPTRLHRLKLQELIWKEVFDFRPHGDCLPVAPSRRLSSGGTDAGAGGTASAAGGM
ncbi:hypothetical protein ACA910_006447 [Epithemia clementina (nom. ined.)]